MSKIFEALELRDRDRSVTPPRAVRPLPRVNGGPGGPRAASPDRVWPHEEEMLTLHRAVATRLSTRPTPSLLFVAARSGEGTTTIVHGFARLLTERLATPALILDTDPWAAAGGSQDLDTLIARGGSVDELVPHTDEAWLRVVPVSRRGTPAAAILATERGRATLQALASRFGTILIDGTAVSEAPDGLDLTPLVDAVVLVVEAERTPWPLARDVSDRIARRGGLLLGLVLNKRRRYLRGGAGSSR